MDVCMYVCTVCMYVLCVKFVCMYVLCVKFVCMYAQYLCRSIAFSYIPLPVVITCQPVTIYGLFPGWYQTSAHKRIGAFVTFVR